MIRRFIAAITLACVVTSCGIPTDNSARVLPPVTVIANPTPTTVTTQNNLSPKQLDNKAIVIFMIRDGGLVGRGRLTSQNFSDSDLLQFLVDGPVPTEVSLTIRSGLTQRPDLFNNLGIENYIAQIELSADFTELPATEQVLILGQITLTLVGNLRIDGVTFLQGGDVIAVPNANLEPVTTPAQRSTYAALLVR